MRRLVDRMVLGGLLCAVALTTSGCLVTVLFATLGIESGEEFDLAIGNISGNALTALCSTDEDGAVACQYAFVGGDEPIGSGAQLIGFIGVLGVFIDPVILQMPSGVTNLSGVVDDPADATPPAPLVISTATSFFAQPGTEVVAEPGKVFVIIDFPASITNSLTTIGKNLTFSFQFQLVGPPGSFSGGIPVKAMFTGKVQAGGQTFYPPMLPCTTSVADVPSITIPVGSGVSLLPQILGAVAQQNPGCSNAVYDFSSLTRTAADHFQCYATTDSRGSLCGGGSPQNTGGACTTEADCGGVEDDTAFCVPKGFPRDVKVALSDQFGSGVFAVKRPAALCNPADKNGEGISDASTHLRSYKIEAAPGQTPHARRTGVRIENQFHPAQGELLIDTIKPDRLLVPTAKSLSEPVTAPDPGSHGVDHFACYKVRPSKGAATFSRIRDVSVVDQFQQPRLVDLTHPTRLCTPVDKNGEGIKNESGHLMCYRAIPVKQPDRSRHVSVPGIHLNNQIAPEIVDTVTEGEFCVPSVSLVEQPLP